MSKLLREKYKTYEGARKRAAFENGVAAYEAKAGFKAMIYRYIVVADPYYPDVWRVERRKPDPAPLAALRHHVTGAVEGE